MMEGFIDLRPRGETVSVDRLLGTITLRFTTPGNPANYLAVSLSLAQAQDALDGLAYCLGPSKAAEDAP
jgi:hypothetical protein